MSTSSNFTAKDRLQLMQALLSTASALRAIAGDLPMGNGKTEAIKHIENLNSSLDNMLDRLKEVING